MSSRAVVVLNAGSSSLKFSVYEIADHRLRPLVRGQIEGLGAKPRFKAKDPAGNTLAESAPKAAGEPYGHAHAFQHMAAWLHDTYGGRFAPVAVGHRVLHGGTDFIRPTVLTPDVLDRLAVLVPLVPLHQPHNLAAIRAVATTRPDLLQVACFDTAFHQGRARVTERFALPSELFDQGVRRWGFHGLSYESVSSTFAAIQPDLARGRVIAAHLGSGASLCAMRDGKSVDTTMAFSTLDGLPMGTRCGCLDPGVILYLLKHLRREEVESMLYNSSGLLGISGVSNDVRDLLASDKPAAAEALDYFVYRAVREISSLAGAIGGLDALLFTAGIGENSPPIRARICAGLAWLGISLDPAANESGNGRISPPSTSPSVWVIPTDEEAVIANHTLALLHRH